jgi:peptidoglycan hydrolase-like protein with peptidoglycan-binding domain
MRQQYTMNHLRFTNYLGEGGVAHYLLPALVFILVFAAGGFVIYESNAAQPCDKQTWQAGDKPSVCVGDVQKILNEAVAVSGAHQVFSPPYKGQTLAVDNTFGGNTYKQVMYFQSYVYGVRDINSSQVDGIVGPNTWTQLCRVTAIVNVSSLKKAKVSQSVIDAANTGNAAGKAAGCS